MTHPLLTRLRDWLSAKTVPWYAPFYEAKKLHENSPNGLFPRSYYHALSADEIQRAAACPRLARAIDLYRECIQREEDAGRVYNQGIALTQLGLVYHRQGKLEAARQVYQQALDILEDLPDAGALTGASTCHFRLAEIFLAQHDLAAARLHLEKSTGIDESLNDPAGLKLSAGLAQRMGG